MFALCGLSDGVFAEACSYQEAIMALQQGNQVRGLALMRMASADGDVRARGYLAAQTSKPRQVQDKPAMPVIRLAQRRD